MPELASIIHHTLELTLLLRKPLLIWLFTAVWALAQLAVIDHVYSDQHSDETLCEWCASNSSGQDDAPVATDSVTPEYVKQLQTNWSPGNFHFDTVAYLTPQSRAPPS